MGTSLNLNEILLEKGFNYRSSKGRVRASVHKSFIRFKFSLLNSYQQARRLFIWSRAVAFYLFSGRNFLFFSEVISLKRFANPEFPGVLNNRFSKQTYLILLKKLEKTYSRKMEHLCSRVKGT